MDGQATGVIRSFDAAAIFGPPRITIPPPPSEATLIDPLTDNPVWTQSDDRFGFEPYVMILHELVHRSEPLPVTVGVFGPWGTGKTSFLRLWHSQLGVAHADRAIWFNPWKYDQRVEIWAALLQTVLAEVAVDPALRDRASRLAQAATWLSLKAGLGIGAKLATGGLIDGKAVEGLVEALSESDRGYYSEVNRFEADFADLVRRVVGDEGRLFIFVDDLDRCAPAAAMTVLESLKLFLGDARCVFVIAMDFDRLAAIAAGKFGDGTTVSGTAYLEKIIQIPFHLPEPDFSAIEAAYKPHVIDIDGFWRIVQAGLGNNPRKVKRFLNLFNIGVAILERDSTVTISAQVLLQLAVVLLIRGEHRETFHALRADPGSWGTALAHAGLEHAATGLQIPAPTPQRLHRMLNAVRLAF